VVVERRHSLTKFLGGHGNSIGGVIVETQRAPLQLLCWNKHAAGSHEHGREGRRTTSVNVIAYKASRLVTGRSATRGVLSGVGPRHPANEGHRR
jgi:O-acetylhomoserine/O-acetylserine sulfhydrylase-like pyridoxal-dependent enzyme